MQNLQIISLHFQRFKFHSELYIDKYILMYALLLFERSLSYRSHFKKRKEKNNSITMLSDFLKDSECQASTCFFITALLVSSKVC